MATDVTTQDQAVAEDSRNMRKEIIGTVTSSKMDKSITVAVVQKQKHPMYGKFVTITAS
jgi:small subunit ribosomal protein S17